MRKEIKVRLIMCGILGFILGTLGGIIIEYGDIYHRLVDIKGMKGLPYPLPHNFEKLLGFLIFGLFLSIVIGLMDRTWRNFISIFLGGLLGGLMNYEFMMLNDTIKTLIVFFPGASYIIFIALFLTLAKLNNYKIFIIGGMASIISCFFTIIIFLINLGFIWGSAMQQDISLLLQLLNYSIMISLLSMGVYLGIVWEERR